MHTNQDIFLHSIQMQGGIKLQVTRIIFLSMRQKMGLPKFACILHVLSMLSYNFQESDI